MNTEFFDGGEQEEAGEAEVMRIQASRIYEYQYCYLVLVEYE
jgi:hypothetical protein